MIWPFTCASHMPIVVRFDAIICPLFFVVAVVAFWRTLEVNIADKFILI